ncbi:hypothetical protein [Streptomyces hypolithicus]
MAEAELPRHFHSPLPGKETDCGSRGQDEGGLVVVYVVAAGEGAYPLVARQA